MSEKVEDRIKELEERLANTKVNKATQKSINYTKAQLAKLREDLIRISSSKKGGGGGFGIRRTGDAQVAFIGFPSGSTIQQGGEQCRNCEKSIDGTWIS